jgi:peptide-methionine (R)-S-oxide reductase
MLESGIDSGGSGRTIARRAFFVAAGGALAVLAWLQFGKSAPIAGAAPAPEPAEPAKDVTIVEFTDAGERKDTVTVPMVRKTDAEWKAQLSPGSYEVARRDGTEVPFTGALLNVHDKGVFRCVCCDTALFSSTTKFESGTGWPSFWAPIAKQNINEFLDESLGMQRTAVSCRLCDAHLGHVFDDGPKPTGLRYCMNSVSMKFSKAA